MHETTSLPRSVRREQVLYEDPYQQMVRVVAEFDGFVKEYYVSERKERSALLVVTDGKVLLSRQYRLLVERVALEIPGGGIEEGETAAEAALRECLEETGVRAFDARPLVKYHPSLDILRNFTHIFLAEACADEKSVAEDRRIWLPLERCLEMIFAGEILDVLTMAAVLAYRALPRNAS
jgi:8-oxo-dGTP pyrophosphatase MutT (NUDIX family)